MNTHEGNMLLKHRIETLSALKMNQQNLSILISLQRWVLNIMAHTLYSRVFSKIRVLQQLTQWTMGNPDRIREKMEEQKDGEQTIWVR